MPTPPSRTDYPAGVPCWIDLEPPNIDAAIAFYGAVFGWRFEDRLPASAPVRYAVATLDGLTVAAVGSARGTAAGSPRWNTYVSVTDADAVVQATATARGEVVVAPEDAGPPGRSAVLADPAGAEIRLWQPGTNHGAQLVNAHGSWNWSNLHTPDAEAVTGFYGELFGWALARVDAGGSEFARMWRRPGYGDHLASLVEPEIRERQDGSGAPPGFADAIAWLVEEPATPSQWVVTFSVDDTDAAVRSVVDHGGSIVAAPHDQGPTRLAVVADDQGTTFTMNTFYPERLSGRGG